VQGEPRAVLITGLFGTGKSSVAIEMADMLEGQELACAVVDLDWSCWGWARGSGRFGAQDDAREPRSGRRELPRGRVRYFIFARSVRTSAELESLRSALSMPLAVVELTEPFSEIERRLAPDITAARQEDLRDAKAWLTAGDGVGLGNLSVPNDRPVRAVASDILHRLGWTEQDYHRGGGEE
jgi:hypothetical protein